MTTTDDAERDALIAAIDEMLDAWAVHEPELHDPLGVTVDRIDNAHAVLYQLRHAAGYRRSAGAGEAALMEAREKIAKALAMVAALCKDRRETGARAWVMSIPARPDYDPDIVIADALYAAEKLLAATPAQPSGETVTDGWIACSDRMPEPLEDVVALWWGGDRCMAHFDDRPGTAGWWFIDRAKGLRRAAIAPNGWVPLPPGIAAAAAAGQAGETKP